MEFVVHNRSNMTLRATLVVAFFASFFSHSTVIEDGIAAGVIETVEPKSEPVYGVNCHSNYQGAHPDHVGLGQCLAWISSHASEQRYEPDYAEERWTHPGVIFDVKYKFCKAVVINDVLNECGTFTTGTLGYYVVTDNVIDQLTSCPPDGDLFHTIPITNSEGKIEACVNPADVDEYYRSLSDLNKADSDCAGLLLDAGNNTATTMCYTSPNGGGSCNVQANFGAGYSYYHGVDSSPFGCAESENPPFDMSGIGDGNDDCITSNGTNFCKANKANHCTTSQGVETCDAGCLSLNGVFMCDPSKHPDVGEGESDYFDDKGTCSVVAGSAYKGACEELGGIWDKAGDYSDTSCPTSSIAGSCSVATNGGCFSCLDSGGTWTPDPSAPLTNTEKGIQDVASLTQDSNDNLKTLDNSLRKGNASLVSTVKSGNNKIVGELKNVANTNIVAGGAVASKVGKLAEELSKDKKYTTTTSPIDRTLINGLFSEQKIEAVKASTEQIKTELQTFITTSKAELSGLLTISSPNSSGYQARSVAIKGSSFDLSLNRFSQYFSLLAGPVMMICSVIALFIILGRNS